MKRIFVLMAMLFAFQSFAQTDYEKPTSIVNKGIKLYDKGKYSESIKWYDKINENDSIYYTALYEKTLALYNLEKLDEALAVINKLIAETPEQNVLYDIMKASILDDLEKYDEAQAIYEEIAYRQPFNQNAWFNLGVSYFKSKDYEKAEAAFIKSIILKPWHYRSNLLLGLTNGMMGRPVHAIVCINMAALMNAGDEFGLSAIKNLEAFTDGALDDDIVAGKYPTPDSITSDKIKALEPIISSHVIGKNKMKMPTKNTYSITKYNYVVFSEIENNMSGNNIYTKFYFPFFKAIYENGYFDVYSYYIMQGVTSAEVQNYLSKKKTKINAFSNWVTNEFANYLKAGKGMRPANIEYQYYQGDLSGVVTYSDSTKKIKEGPYYEIMSNGVVEYEGNYKNDIPVGTFYYNFPDGTRNMKVEYIDEEETSVLTIYEHNGDIASRIEMRKGKKEGKYEEYFPDGKLSGVYIYKNDLFTGEAFQLFHNGDTAAIDRPLADSTHFEVTLYYPGGKIYRTYIRNKTEYVFDGKYTQYYENGKPSEISEMKNNIYIGDYKTFLINGDTADVRHFDQKGNSIGTDKSYGTNGKLLSTREHVKTNETYNYKEFDIRGRVVLEMRITADKFNSLIQYDTTGKEINHLENLNKGDAEYQLLDIYTGKVTLRNTLKNGQREGKSTIYSYTGTLSGEANYKNDKFDGKYIVYYPSGKIYYYFYYKDGIKDGYYEGYYPNEKIEANGYYYNGEKVGYWTFFNPDGTVNRTEYYQQSGNQNGWEIQYANDSLIVYKEHYTNNNLDEAMIFDPEADTIAQYSVVNGLHDGKVYYKNGKLWKRFQYIDNRLSDSLITYYPDGNILTAGFFSRDGYNGTYTYYFPDGSINRKIDYINGEMNGKDIEYNPDGTIHFESTYNDNEENAPTIYYHYNNKPFSIISNVNEDRNGNADYYTPDGEFMFRLIYFNDNMIAFTWMDKNHNMLPPVMVDKDTVNIVMYYANGAKSGEWLMLGGEREGDRFFYYPNGKIMESEHYECGRLNGPDIYYRTDGSKVLEYNYSYGLKHGKCIYYHPNGKPMLETEYFYGDKNGAEKQYSSDGKLIATRIYFGGNLIEVK